MRKRTRNASGDDDAEGAQQHCGRGDRFGTVDVGVKAAVEHDEQQRRAAGGFGERIVAKVDVRRTVDAQQHAQRDKDEQGGEGELFADGFDGQAQNNNEADKKKYLVHGWCPLLGGWRGRSVICGYLYPKMVGLWAWIAGVRIFDTRLRRERRWSGRWARRRGVSGAGGQACAGDR